MDIEEESLDLETNLGDHDEDMTLVQYQKEVNWRLWPE